MEIVSPGCIVILPCDMYFPANPGENSANLSQSRTKENLSFQGEGEGAGFPVSIKGKMERVKS